MTCPNCGATTNAVLNSRPQRHLTSRRVRRRRECSLCHTRFTTYEVHEHEWHTILGQLRAYYRAAFKKPEVQDRWNEVDWALTNREIAERMGCTRNAVVMQRRRREIP